MFKPALRWYIFALRFKNWQRYFITLSIISFILFFWYFFNYRSISKQLKLLDSKLKLLEKQDSFLEKSNTEQFPNSFSSLLPLFTKYQLIIENFEQQEDSFGEKKMQLKLIGDFDNFYNFMKEAIDSFLSITIEVCQLKPFQNQTNLIECSLTINIAKV